MSSPAELIMNTGEVINISYYTEGAATFIAYAVVIIDEIDL